MIASTSSSVNLGKRPAWRLTDEQLLRLPSIIDGMDVNQELKMRHQATHFIQDMAEKLNQNFQQRGKINQTCICVSMVQMHRFFSVHSFSMFDPRDVAAACLFLAGKSEECPRKLEHIVEVWFKLKHKKSDVQLPFNEMIRKESAELIVYIESVLLQTIGFDLRVELPHPMVIQQMSDFAGAQPMARCAYWFASEMIRLTTFPIRYSIAAIACLSIYLVSNWSDFEIPETDGTPWFKKIEQEMTLELLNKLADEFTLIYKECGSSESRKAMDNLRRIHHQPSSSASSILPPPPPPPNLKLERDSAAGSVGKQHQIGSPDKREPANPLKRSLMGTENLKPIKVANDSVSTPTKIPGEKLQQIPQLKLEPNSPMSNNSPSAPAGISSSDDLLSTKKKITLSEYKQRLKIKQEPTEI